MKYNTAISTLTFISYECSRNVEDNNSFSVDLSVLLFMNSSVHKLYLLSECR